MAKQNPLSGCLGIIVLAVVIGVFITMCSSGSNSGSGGSSGSNSADSSSTNIPVTGEVYWFKIHPMCLDDFNAFDALSSAEVKHDQEGAEQVLMQHGVDIGSGTHVRILNVDIFRSDVDVRVVSEDSSHYGEEIYCFVPPNSGGQPMFDKALQHV